MAGREDEVLASVSLDLDRSTAATGSRRLVEQPRLLLWSCTLRQTNCSSPCAFVPPAATASSSSLHADVRTNYRYASTCPTGHRFIAA